MIDPDILIMAVGCGLVFRHYRKLKKDEREFNRWAEKDREADAAF